MAETSVRPAATRRYRSPLREQRARATRERILESARAEFLARGYAATTLRAVASRAGVSIPTVEQAFGTKPALLDAAIGYSIRGDAEPVPMLQRGWALAASRARTAPELLAIAARVLADSARRAAGLIAAALESAAQDPALAALAEQLRAQRLETAAWLIDGLLARTSLRPGVDREQAIDTVWLLMDPRLYRAATEDRGWSEHLFAQWLADAVSRLVLAPEPAGRAGGGRRSRPAASVPDTTDRKRRP